jgi:hypothetical protein
MEWAAGCIRGCANKLLKSTGVIPLKIRQAKWLEWVREKVMLSANRALSAWQRRAARRAVTIPRQGKIVAPGRPRNWRIPTDYRITSLPAVEYRCPPDLR